MILFHLTHWGRVMHICIGELTIIGSNNGLSPYRRQAIIWTNTGLLLIGPLGRNFSEILIEILTFSFKKMRLKVSSVKRGPFCLCLNVLMQWLSPILVHCQSSLQLGRLSTWQADNHCCWADSTVHLPFTTTLFSYYNSIGSTLFLWPILLMIFPAQFKSYETFILLSSRFPTKFSLQNFSHDITGVGTTWNTVIRSGWSRLAFITVTS